MSALILCLRIAGGLLMVLAAAHVPICRHFHWQEEAKTLSPFNRQVLLVHAFFIALAVGLMGALVFFWARALTEPSALGFPVAAGLTLFWSARLFVQLFVYDRALWRGKRFETTMHVLFTAFWTYLVFVFAWCARLQWSSPGR